MIGVPEGTRTPDLRFRKPPLYPAELPGPNATCLAAIRCPGTPDGCLRAGANWLSSRGPRLARSATSANDRLRTPREQGHGILERPPSFTKYPRRAGSTRLSASFRGRGRLSVSGCVYRVCQPNCSPPARPGGAIACACWTRVRSRCRPCSGRPAMRSAMIDISSQTPRSNPPTRDALQGRMLYELIPPCRSCGCCH